MDGLFAFHYSLGGPGVQAFYHLDLIDHIIPRFSDDVFEWDAAETYRIIIEYN